MKFESETFLQPQKNLESQTPLSEKGLAQGGVEDVSDELSFTLDQSDVEEAEQAHMADLTAANDLLEKIKNGTLGEIKPDFESDPTLVLFERMNNPVIQEQMVELLLKSEAFKVTEMINVSEEMIDENGKMMFDDLDMPMRKKVTRLRFPDYVPKTQRELMLQVQSRAQEVTSLEGERNVVHLYPEKSPDMDDQDAYHDKYDEVFMSLKSGLSSEQKAVFLAHEKGHQLRRYRGLTHLDQQFREVIDWENLPVTPEELKVLQSREASMVDWDLEEAQKKMKDYFDACEIVERMSQLKNYFGFRGNQSVTKKHLDYAKQHYVEDIGFDNDMALFLRAITPGKEEQFLETINTLGV